MSRKSSDKIKVDREQAVITLEYDADGDELDEPVEHRLPLKYEVCHGCGGKGRHVNRNIDGNGITASEWENDWDEESREAYMSGKYDVTCETCDGDRVLPTVDVERLSPEQKKIYDQWDEHWIDVARENYEDRMTRRMESGGYDY